MTDVAALDIRVKTTGADRATGNLRKLERQSGKVKTATQRMERSFLSLKRVAIAAFAAIAAQSVIAFQAIKVGASFEQQMAKVRGITNATISEFIALTDIAKKLGATTEWSATQAAQGLEFLGMAGFSAAKSIKALPGVLDLATAGAIDLGRAADIVSNALTAMRLPVEELARVNDVFVRTITSSNTNMEMMAESFKYSAPLAASYGMEIETLAGLIGMLGNAGIQGSMAGTQLAFGFQNVTKVFDKYGESLTRADGSTKDYIDALRLLEERGASTNEVMKIFGVRAGRAALALMGQGVPALEAYIREIENAKGATSKLANIMRDTLTGDIKTLKSTLEDLSIALFATWGADLRVLVQSATQIIRENKDSLVEFFKGMATGALSAFKAIIKGIAKLREAFLGLISIVGMVKQGFAEITIKGLEVEVARIEHRIAALRKDPSWREKTFGGASKDRREEALKSAMGKRVELLQQIVDERQEISALTMTQLEIETDLNRQLIDIDKITEDIKEKLKAQAVIKDDIVKSDKLTNEAIKGVGDSLSEVTPKINEAYEKLKAFFAIHTLADKAARDVERLALEYIKIEKQLISLWKTDKITDEQLLESMDQMVIAHKNDLAIMIDDTEDTTEQIDELWVRALDRIQSTLADTFMDGMKGELDSFKDVFKSFCDVILRYWAEMAAKMTMYDIFGVGKGAGGSGWGSFLGGIMGGGGGGGSPAGQTAAQAAMMAGHGPVSEEWALAQGFRNTAQGAGAAWSLKGVYGAYQGAGGGWAGVQAGAGSLGGGIGAGISGISWTGWAAIAYFASELLSGLNVKKGYGQLTYAPRGYGYGGEFQPTSPFQGDFGTDPLGTYIRGVLGIDDIPMAGNYFSAAIKESDWWEAMKALPATILEWSSPFITMGLSALGLDLGKIFGFGNKKRSYYGKSFEFGEYSPETGWGDPLGEVYKDKRKGEKAFGESGESMAQSGHDLINALDKMFKELLGRFGETWENLFTTKMIDLSASGLSFDFHISAEDKGEFKDDWRKSWAAMAEGLVDPIIDAGADLLSQALDGAVTDATAWNYFSDEMREHLKTGLEDGLAGLKVDWSTATSQKAFEEALTQMSTSAENIQGILDYFTQVGDIMDQVSEAISMSEFSEPARAAVQSLRSINVQFDEFSNVLLSLGVDIKKYTDLEIARHIAITAEVKAMSNAAMSGKDLALSLKYMREEMEAAGHAAHEIADAMDAAFSGILESIEDIERRHEDYGKTALELLLEKHPEWGDISTYDQWAEINQMFRSMFEELRYDYAKPYDFEEWLREQQGIDAETLQEWRNLGFELEKLFEKMYDEMAKDQLVDEVKNLVDAENDIAKELLKVMKEFRDFQVKLMSELFGITGQGALALSPEQWKVVMAEAFKDQIPGNMGLDLDIDLIRNLMSLGQDYMNSMKMQFTNQYDWIKFVSMFLKDIDSIIMRLGSAGGPGRKLFGYDMDQYFYEPSRGMTDTGPARFERFASGGWHEGGWGVFGESGPELVYTPPTRVYSNDVSKQMIGSNQGVIDEIRGLKATVKVLFGKVSRNTKDQADILKRFDWDGLPPERT